MNNEIAILRPVQQVDENKELLIELLKNERKANMKRIEQQRQKIVQLTASRNEMLAELNGISDSEHQQLQDHVQDMEENAKKMAAEVESLHKTLSHRTADIENMHKTIESLNKHIIEREQTIDCQDITIKALRKRIKELENVAGYDVGKSLGDIFESMYHDAKDFGIDVDKKDDVESLDDDE